MRIVYTIFSTIFIINQALCGDRPQTPKEIRKLTQKIINQNPACLCTNNVHEIIKEHEKIIAKLTPLEFRSLEVEAIYREKYPPLAVSLLEKQKNSLHTILKQRSSLGSGAEIYNTTVMNIQATNTANHLQQIPHSPHQKPSACDWRLLGYCCAASLCTGILCRMYGS